MEEDLDIHNDISIETLIHYKIIAASSNINQNGYAEIQFGDVRKKIDIKTGIRQGCTVQGQQYSSKLLHIS